MTKDRQKAVYTATPGQELILPSLCKLSTPNEDDPIILGKTCQQNKQTKIPDTNNEHFVKYH